MRTSSFALNPVPLTVNGAVRTLSACRARCAGRRSATTAGPATRSARRQRDAVLLETRRVLRERSAAGASGRSRARRGRRAGRRRGGRGRGAASPATGGESDRAEDEQCGEAGTERLRAREGSRCTGRSKRRHVFSRPAGHVENLRLRCECAVAVRVRSDSRDRYGAVRRFGRPRRSASASTTASLCSVSRAA